MDHNVYFEGKVQSLTVETEQGRATVGVITPGKYTFSTSTQERMVVTSGTLAVTLSQPPLMSKRAVMYRISVITSDED
jgi:uncharacterized protein YaiE (UPF0345 family)